MIACIAASAFPRVPTYVLWGEEMDSPRGRIYMMKKSAAGRGSAGPDVPAAYGQLPGMHGVHDGVSLRRAIQQADRRHARPGGAQYSAARRLAFPQAAVRHLSASVSGCGCWLCPCCIYQRSGLQKMLRATGLLRLLPKRLAQMEALLPRVPALCREPVRVVTRRGTATRGLACSPAACNRFSSST